MRHKLGSSTRFRYLVLVKRSVRTSAALLNTGARAGACRDGTTEADGRCRTSHPALNTCVGIDLHMSPTPYLHARSEVSRPPSASVIPRAHPPEPAQRSRFGRRCQNSVNRSCRFARLLGARTALHAVFHAHHTTWVDVRAREQQRRSRRTRWQQRNAAPQQNRNDGHLDGVHLACGEEAGK